MTGIEVWYLELANELRAIEKACRDRLDGQPILEAAKALEELEAYCKELMHALGYVQRMPKRGEWIEENRRPRSTMFVCSECNGTAYFPQPTRDKAWRKGCGYAYCPNCGAKMDGGAKHDRV